MTREQLQVINYLVGLQDSVCGLKASGRAKSIDAYLGELNSVCARALASLGFNTPQTPKVDK